MYATILKLLHKGTGGGSGISTIVEGWSEKKLERHELDLEIYDHEEVSTQPAVLAHNYTKKTNTLHNSNTLIGQNQRLSVIK